MTHSATHTHSATRHAPIGIFDSGIGGFTVLRHVVKQLPHEDIIYVADQANVPYGEKREERIYALSETITHYLLSCNCKLIIVACNTATAAALSKLRAQFDVLFVGMEPAVKPGALATKTGIVGVLATAGTFQSQRYASLMERYAEDVRVLENRCAGLVDLIEAGQIESEEMAILLHDIITPMLTAGADTLVLGCTHYPFVENLITHIAGNDVTIIDPAPAVARHVHALLEQHNLLNRSATEGQLTLLTTGDEERFAEQVVNLGLLKYHPASPSESAY